MQAPDPQQATLSPDQRRTLKVIAEYDKPVSSANLPELLEMPELSEHAASERLRRMRHKGVLRIVLVERTCGRPRRWYRARTTDEQLKEALRVWCLAAICL